MFILLGIAYAFNACLDGCGIHKEGLVIYYQSHQFSILNVSKRSLFEYLIIMEYGLQSKFYVAVKRFMFIVLYIFTTALAAYPIYNLYLKTQMTWIPVVLSSVDVTILFGEPCYLFNCAILRCRSDLSDVILHTALGYAFLSSVRRCFISNETRNAVLTSMFVNTNNYF